MSRHQRRRVEFAQRASMQRYRGEANGKGGLLTFLIDAREPIREPILARAASWWLNLLPSASRHCFVCNCIFLARFDVAALLLSTPALTSSAVSVNGACHVCWSEAPLAEIERAVERVLGAVVVGGRLEAFAVTW
jgi:hypothetical protein